MKNTLLNLLIIASLFLAAGCGKKSSDNPATTPPAPKNTASSAAAGTALTDWQQGDKTSAVSNFVATDWSARPLFGTGSPLDLSEEQFTQLSDIDRAANSKELLAYLGSLKEMAQAVAQKGREAAAAGDSAGAQKYFDALKQAGTALQSPDFTQLVQMVGKAFVKMADVESAKTGQ